MKAMTLPDLNASWSVARAITEELEASTLRAAHDYCAGSR
jgi:hypothetical protein